MNRLVCDHMLRCLIQDGRTLCTLPETRWSAPSKSLKIHGRYTLKG
jgi:hypothetical protein